jgi:hypothetical protein
MAKQIITVTPQALLNSGMVSSTYNRIIRAVQGADFTDADAALQEYLAPGFAGELQVTGIVEHFGLAAGLQALGASGHVAAPALARMFAVQCVRRIQKKLVDPRSAAALDVAEAFAKGQMNDDELAFASDKASDATAACLAERTGACYAALEAAAWAVSSNPDHECAIRAAAYSASAAADLCDEDDCAAPTVEQLEVVAAESAAQVEMLLTMLRGESIPDGWYVGAGDECEYDAMILAAVCEDMNVMNMPVADPTVYSFDQAGLRRFVRSILEIVEDERGA